MKLGFYRRIAAAPSSESIASLEEELEDRCGPLPPPARLLLDIARLRVVGQEHGIARFALEKGGVLQMTLRDPAKATPFLRQRLRAELRLPEAGLAIVASPVRPGDAGAALYRFLELLA